MITVGVEDYLATIYVLSHEHQTVIGARLATCLGVKPPSVTEMVRRLAQEGYVTVGRRKGIQLTSAGHAIAEATVRRRRVVERWLTDILGLDWTGVHDVAHRLEHSVSPEIVERLFAALGQPTTCPHGHVIPGSDVGSTASLSLDRVTPGAEVVVDRVPEAGEQLSELLSYLDQLGIRPGVRVRMIGAVHSTGVIDVELGPRRLALGNGAAERIWVRPVQVEPRPAADMPQPEPEIEVTVQAVYGACRAAHQLGERFQIGCRTPAGLCSEAFQAIYPLTEGLRARAATEGVDRATIDVPCPDDGSVVFRLEVRRDSNHQSDP